MSGGKAYLVAVGRIAGGGGGGDFSGRKLAGNGFVNRQQGIRCTGNAHRLIYEGAAGKGIAYGSAKACCRAAEGLYLGGMVMGLVFEHKQPLFVFSVVVNGNLYGAGVYFFAFVKVGQKAVFFQFFGCKGGNVHKAKRFVSSSQFLTVYLIFLIRVGNIGSFYICAVDNCAEGGMTAVVAPVGVYHSYFGDGRTAVFALEIILAELYVIVVHGKAVFFHKVRKAAVIQVQKTVKSSNFRGNVIFYL